MPRQPERLTDPPGGKTVRYLLGPVATVFDATLTGAWRIQRPQVDRACNYCGMCAMYCPPGVIRVEKEKRVYAVDWDYCKGCGICANVCPRGSLKMVPEGGA